jgi:predicted nuclease of predicted toxin-antitoxin system
MLRYYFDHNIQRQIASGLRLRGVDLLTAYEDAMHEAADGDVLARAYQAHRVLVTKDHDFLKIARDRLRQQISFPGVIYITKDNLPIGQCIEELELVAKVYEPEEVSGRILFLPL